MATESTGKVGDADTAMAYIDSKGRVRIVYSSNKQSLSDAFSNATVKSASEVIKESEVEGANSEALASQVEDSVADAVEFNKTYTRRNREIDLTEFYNLVYQYENDCLKAALEYNKTFYSDSDIEPEEQLFFSLTIVPFTKINTTNLK